MPRRPPQTVRHGTVTAKASRPGLAGHLRIVLAVALLAGIVAGVLVSWEQLFPTPPERLVNVYRTHGCLCVFAWTRSLEAQGFVVRSREYETLKYLRASLQMPANLHGCHVAVYLGYFVEGHVAPLALHRLSTERPEGRGLAMRATATVETEHSDDIRENNSAVLLFDTRGGSRRW